MKLHPPPPRPSPTRGEGKASSTLLAIAGAAALAACGTDVTYRPAPQLLPQHIKNVAVRPFANRTQQFGLEDKLTLRVIDEFLRDGRYKAVPESQSDGVLAGTLNRYILTPIQFDPNLVPTAYKLQVFMNLRLIDRTKNQVLWEEPNLVEELTYTASTLPGGLSEEQARERVWDLFAKDIVARTVEGFGSVTGASERKFATVEGQDKPPLPSPPLQPEPH